MASWFAWIPTARGGFAPQVIYSHLTQTILKNAVAVHELTEEDYEAVKKRKDGESQLDILAQRYPAPREEWR